MSLQIKARWRALKHIRGIFPRAGCRIWRLYSHFGFRTRAVICECGEVFVSEPDAWPIVHAFYDHRNLTVAKELHNEPR